MSRTIPAVSTATLLAAVVLTIAGCGSSGSSSNLAASRPGTAATEAPASNTNTNTNANTSASGGASASGSSSTSCSHGLQPGANGVVDIECGGLATIHITAGSVSKSITGGTCREAGGTWTVTAGVITQYGVYSGPPVDVVSVAATVGKDATIQAELSGKMLLVESASFTLSADHKSAHLAGTSNRNADIASTPTTVDVTC